MNATQARKISNAENTRARKQHRRVQSQKPKIDIRSLVAAIENRIEQTAKSGNYWLRCDVPSKAIGEKVAASLRRKKFVVTVTTHTEFTGVDEWDEHPVIDISWSTQREHRGPSSTNRDTVTRGRSAGR